MRIEDLKDWTVDQLKKKRLFVCLKNVKRNNMKF